MANVDRSTPPPSPCNLTCIVDRAKNWCVGCLRTMEEVGMWAQMSPEEQWDVIDKIAQRRASLERNGT
jgi:predicted Fe-S protein YdhL (DUF1289 family)